MKNNTKFVVFIAMIAIILFSGCVHTSLPTIFNGDFDEDGVPDKIIVQRQNCGFFEGNCDKIFISLGNSNESLEITQESEIDSILIAEINGDGHLDIVYKIGERPILILGNGDGTFQKKRGVEIEDLICG